MATETVHDFTFTTAMTCDIDVQVKGSHSYSGTHASGDPWAASIVLDGVTLDSAGGVVVIDVWSLLGGSLQVPAGTHNVKVLWYGAAPYLKLVNCNMKISGRYF